MRRADLLHTLKTFDHFDRRHDTQHDTQPPDATDQRMDHRYIDENSVAERYLGGRLANQEREAFERHLVDCQECTDRILLAGMFLARRGNGASSLKSPGLAKSVAEPSRPAGKSESAPPAGLIVRLKPRQLVLILLVSVLLLLAIPILAGLLFGRYSAH